MQSYSRYEGLIACPIPITILTAMNFHPIHFAWMLIFAIVLVRSAPIARNRNDLRSVEPLARASNDSPAARLLTETSHTRTVNSPSHITSRTEPASEVSALETHSFVLICL